MNVLTSLSPAEHAAVLALVNHTEAADGVRPLNDEAMAAVARDGDTHVLIADDAGGVAAVGYAFVSSAFGTAQLVVHPAHRRRGHGRALLDAARTAGGSGIWSFGDLPPARALARSADLTPVRSLLIMERDLQNLPAPTATHDVRLRTFTDADADALLAVNAAAFAHHPEQDAMTRADLEAKQREPWWDPTGIIVATDAEGLVGFHWTKRHDATTGEVYVIGVDPRASGRGIGTLLLDAGLAYLAAVGATRVILYVESDNPAVRLYERTGFATFHTDVLYR